jgi:hypothetical protein
MAAARRAVVKDLEVCMDKWHIDRDERSFGETDFVLPPNKSPSGP